MLLFIFFNSTKHAFGCVFTQMTNQSFERFISDNNISQEHVWSPSTVFCSERECAYQKDGAPYCFDSEHLTLTGVVQLKPLFNEIGLYLVSSNQRYYIH